jgi:tetratricopeptide (TPR) repeat protein
MKALEEIGISRFLPSPGFAFIVLSMVLFGAFGYWIAKDEWYMRLNKVEGKLDYSYYLEELAAREENEAKRKQLLSSAMKFRSWAYIDSKRWKEAIPLIEHMLNEDPENCRNHYNFAAAFRGTGDKNGAILHYSRAIESGCGDYHVYLERGDLYLQQRQYEKSIADFKAALKVEPSNHDAQKKLETAQNLLSDRGKL